MARRVHPPQLRPTRADLGTRRGDVRLLEVASTVLSRLRGAKSEAKVSMRAEVARLVVSGPRELVDLARSAAVDLVAAGAVAQVIWVAATDSVAGLQPSGVPALTVQVILAAPAGA